MKAPTTPAQFRRSAERIFRSANPDLSSLKIAWIETVRVSKWADGSSGFRGSFSASADGHRARVMSATWCGGLMVR